MKRLRPGRKAAYIGGALAFAIAALLVFKWFSPKPAAAPIDPYSAEKRVIATGLAPVLEPGHTMIERMVALDALQPQLAKLPAKERRATLVNIGMDSISASLRSLKDLPPDARQERIDAICRDARQAQAFFRRMPDHKRHELIGVVGSAGGGEAFNRVNTIITSELAPRDRRALGPAIAIWYGILKGEKR